MVEEKVFKLVEEVSREYFPNRILDRLDTRLRNCLGIDKKASYEYGVCFDKPREDPLIGTLAYSKETRPYTRGSWVSETINFFKEEGFDIKDSHPSTYMSREEKGYIVLFRNEDDAWKIQICPGPKPLVKSSMCF